MKPMYSVLTGLVALAIVGCGGGGGGGSTTTASPEGVYEGTSSAGKYFNTLILENNLIYTIYGGVTSNVFGVQGIIIGDGQVNGNNFTSTNAKDFMAGSAINATINATFTPNTNFNGSIVENGVTTTYNGQPLANSNYNYNTAANISNIAGAWNLTTLTGAAVSLNVAANGSFTGTTAGCSFAGSMSPRATGKNVFNMTITFGASPCTSPNLTVTGHAVEYLLANNQRQLIIAGTDATRASARIYLGAR